MRGKKVCHERKQTNKAVRTFMKYLIKVREVTAALMQFHVMRLANERPGWTHIIGGSLLK